MRIILDDKVKNINTQQELDEFIGLEVNENRPIDLNAYSRLISLRKGEPVRWDDGSIMEPSDWVSAVLSIYRNQE